MPEQAMIEFSLILHRDSAHYLLALLRSGSLDVVASERAIEIARSDSDEVVLRMASQLGIAAEDVDLQVVRQLAREFASEGRTYRLSAAPEDAGFRLSYKDLADWTRDELITHVILEEFLFLTSESWIFSKTRRAFDAMVEAGGMAISLSRRTFDRVLRRTLKKGPEEPLSRGNKVRAIAKWVAVGGSSIAGLVEPISGAVLTAATGTFLLVDP